MLKAFVCNTSIDNINVEEKYKRYVETKSTHRYVTMTLLQLEQMYGTSDDGKAIIADITKGALARSSVKRSSCIPRSKGYAAPAERQPEGYDVQGPQGDGR